MDATEQAIDQTMRLALSGAEYAIRLSGTSAERLAAALWSVATTQQKTKGKVRLESLLKSGKELKVFNTIESDLPTFVKEAKRYGVLYAVIKETGESPEGLVDIMVKAEDAAKINRIVERLGYGRFDDTDVVVEAELDLAKRDGGKGAADKGTQAKDTDELLKELLGGEGKDESSLTNPTAAKTESPAPSEPSLDKGGHQDKSIVEEKTHEPDADVQLEKRTSKTREGHGFSDERERPSVKQKIEEKRDERAARHKNPDQPTKPTQTKHQAPPATKRRGSKPKPEKGR